MGSRFYKSLYVPLAGWLQASEEGEYSIILAEVLSFKTSLCSSQLGRIMKPIGKVLCATGVVAGLIAFFWKDDFHPGRLARGVISS